MPSPFTSKVVKRVDVPNDPGQWIEVRMPSLEILADADRAEGNYETTILMLQKCITAWSYKDAITPELVADLSFDVAKKLRDVLWEVPTEEEQKNSSAPSTTP